jgi:hypothetical protein
MSLPNRALLLVGLALSGFGIGLVLLALWGLLLVFGERRATRRPEPDRPDPARRAVDLNAPGVTSLAFVADRDGVYVAELNFQTGASGAGVYLEGANLLSTVRVPASARLSRPVVAWRVAEAGREIHPTVVTPTEISFPVRAGIAYAVEMHVRRTAAWGRMPPATLEPRPADRHDDGDLFLPAAIATRGGLYAAGGGALVLLARWFGRK